MKDQRLVKLDPNANPMLTGRHFRIDPEWEEEN